MVNKLPSMNTWGPHRLTSYRFQSDHRHSVNVWERSPRHCSVMLPDGSCSQVVLRPGSSIRDVLQELCCNISVNMAAVDLFLVGGEKVSMAGWHLGISRGQRDKHLYCRRTFLHVILLLIVIYWLNALLERTYLCGAGT